LTKLGSFAGIALEGECEENSGTHAVKLHITYTSATPLPIMQTEVRSLDGAAATIGNSAFTLAAAATPEEFVNLEAETTKVSSERFDGTYASPKLIFSEGYFVTGGPSGKCEADIGWTPAS
jgi:hypothetical protein